MSKGKYSHFWALYNRMPNKYEGMKEDLVHQFTGGKTTSLRSMSSEEYGKLLLHLDKQVNKESYGKKKLWTNYNLDQCRKRVIASICGYFDLIDEPHTLKKVKATACRSAKTSDFNALPAKELHRIYNVFRAKQRDIKKGQDKHRKNMSKIHLN